MSRWFILPLLAVAAFAQQADTKKADAKTPDSKENVQLPPEEDTAAIPEQYSFNPVKSKRDVSVGEFYFKKGDYKGAAQRFTSATKWNDGNAEAWLRLGETREKQQDADAAREAYRTVFAIGSECEECRGSEEETGEVEVTAWKSWTGGSARATLLLLVCGIAYSAPKTRLAEVENIAPSSYRVDLTLDPEKGTFSGAVSIQMDVKQAVDTIWLNQEQIQIQSAVVTAGGRFDYHSDGCGGRRFCGAEAGIGAAERAGYLDDSLHGRGEREEHGGDFPAAGERQLVHLYAVRSRPTRGRRFPASTSRLTRRRGN